jgi:zinc protease
MKKIFLLQIYIATLFLFCVSLYAQNPDRTKPPQLPPPQQLKLPEIRAFSLSNGLKVVLMEKHEVPLIQLNVIIKTGIVNDPENKSGLANFTMDMINEGAAGKSSLEIADMIDYLGAKIRTSAGAHYSGVYLHAPLTKFDEALKILKSIVLKPDFPQKELDRKKKERLTTIMQWHDQPTAIASSAFNQFLFGKEYPYAKSSLGNEASIKATSVEDLKDFHKKYFVSNNAFIIAVGDINKEELKNKLENIFGSWEKGKVGDISLKTVAQVNKRVVYLIDKPGTPQSVINIGRIGAARLTDDYNSIVVMNTLLGGSFGSRLNQNLREEHGYTYGAFSRFNFRLFPGSFIASSSVQTDVTDKALYEFFKELNGIREPLSDTDLNRAKNYVALNYPSDFQSAGEIAGQLEEMVEYNLPENYFNEYISKMLAVTGNEVNAAAKKYIIPDQMIIVIVGDKSKIEEGIKALNLGEIINLTIDDVIGKVPLLEN